MTFALRVSRDGAEAFEAEISELYAKTIALLASAIPLQLSLRPDGAPIFVGRLMMTIEDALQVCPTLHSAWVAMSADSTVQSVHVEVVGLCGEFAEPHVARDLPLGVGGLGGTGAWPGGGGGGGGAGLHKGGYGGDGAGGAAVIFQYSQDREPIDVDVMVSPGSFDWVVRKNVNYVDPILIGGGGGGGQGGPAPPR